MSCNTLRCEFTYEFLGCIDNLLAPAVGECDGDPAIAGVAAILQLLGGLGEALRQQIEAADEPDGNIMSFDLLGDIAEQVDEDVLVRLFLRARKIFGGK